MPFPIGYVNQYIGPDHCTKSGAETLAKRIGDYWRMKGRQEPVMRVEPFVAARKGRTEVPSWYGIRSDMVNGLPLGPAPQRGTASERNGTRTDSGTVDSLSFRYGPPRVVWETVLK